MSYPSSTYVTLSPSVAQTITVQRYGAHYVSVLLVAGDSAVYFRTDGTAATVAGDDNECLPAAVGMELTVVAKDTAGQISVSVISEGAVTVGVRAVA